jgi:hypothetical protein
VSRSIATAPFRLRLQFMGRTDVPGMVTGRRVIVEGTPPEEHGSMVMGNPLYAFAAED